MTITPSQSAVLLDVLGKSEPLDFIQDTLLSMCPVLFTDDDEHQNWVSSLAGLLGLRSEDLVVVGSARTGVSLNPNKNFKPFDADSDIDVAVLSSSLFENAWERLRNWGAGRLTIPTEAKTSLRNHRQFHIFWETVATDELVQFLPFGKRWMIAFADMAREGPSEGRVIKARIYRNLEALVTYQTKGVIKAKEKLNDVY